jgi:hypothetical protein
MQNYSFFLFSRLYGLYYDTDTLPYDELFGEVVVMYENYENSAYNDSNKPEYECMIDYLYNTSKN